MKKATNVAIPFQLAATSTAREYRGSLITAGRIRNVLDEPGHIYVLEDAIKTAVDAGMFEGLACFVDHSERWGSASMHELLGAWHSVEWDEELKAAVGTLRVYPNAETNPIAERLDQMLADLGAGIPVPDTGVSLHFYAIWGERESYDDPLMLAGFKKIQSGDIVFTPAADGRILEMLSALMPQQEEATDLVAGDEGMFLTREQVDAHLAASGLPETAIGSLAKGTYKDIQALDAAIDAVERGIAALALNALAERDGAEASVTAPDMAVVLAAIGAIGERLDGMETAVNLMAEDDTIQEMGANPRQSTPDIQVVDTRETLSGHVDWFFGVEDAPAPPSNYRNLSQLYIALTGDSDFYGKYDAERVQFTGANVTDLPNMAVNAMNKVMTAQFSALSFWRWFEQVTDVVGNDGSLNPMKWITLGGLSNLPTVAEKGDYTELGMGDALESSEFVKKGGYIGITLEMFRNSEMLTVRNIAKALAIAAVRTRSAAVSALFTANAGVGPTLGQDSKALFHVDHTNVATTAFSEAAWRVARAECFKHAELNSGKALGVFPAFALVAADNYDLALTTFGYGEGMPTTYTPEAQSRGLHDPRPVPLAVPDWTDSNDWGYVVDPKVSPVIQMSYAQSAGGGKHPLPELFTVSSPTGGLMFTNDTLPIKVRDLFAVGVNGPRGIGKRNVA